MAKIVLDLHDIFNKSFTIRLRLVVVVCLISMVKQVAIGTDSTREQAARAERFKITGEAMRVPYIRSSLKSRRGPPG